MESFVQGRASDWSVAIIGFSRQSSPGGLRPGSFRTRPRHRGRETLSGRLPLHSAGAIPAVPEIERVGSAALGGNGATLARLKAPVLPFPLHPRHISSGPRFQSVHQRRRRSGMSGAARRGSAIPIGLFRRREAALDGLDDGRGPLVIRRNRGRTER
jgi:hypothetical protein